MIGKFKVLDVHPNDAFYPIKDVVIGEALWLDVRNDQFVSGWSSTDCNDDLDEVEHFYSGSAFYAVKLEFLSA